MSRQIVVTHTQLHAGQTAALAYPARFRAIRCGRRWGKTLLGVELAVRKVQLPRFVGWFAPSYKIMSEAYSDVVDHLGEFVSASSKIDGVIHTLCKGRVDMWTLEDERAGRSRSYDLVILDEAAFTKPNMMDIWDKAIKPTLLDRRGQAVVLSNTNGNNPENFFWRICNESEHEFREYHAPSSSNPFLPADEIERLRKITPPLVWAQEYEAEFVDWSGVAFFAIEKLLVDNQGTNYPKHCDFTFAVIDTALKTGTDNDGTGTGYFARSAHTGVPLTILDWDIRQIEGASLEAWLPTVFARLEELAVQTHARLGALGVFIEDRGSGTVLIQQARNHGWKVHAIPETITGIGKDERAIASSSYVYQEHVKLSKHAYDKVSLYKGVTRNHFLAQVTGFRVGDKDAGKRADDLLDCFCSGIMLSLGNYLGF